MKFQIQSTSFHVKLILFNLQRMTAEDLVFDENDRTIFKARIEQLTDYDYSHPTFHHFIKEEVLDKVYQPISEHTLEKRLFNAILRENLNEVEFLVEQGANVNARKLRRSDLKHYQSYIDTCGETPLYYAANVKNIELIKCLVSHGADINARVGLDGDSILFYRDYEASKLLIESGIDVNAKNSLKRTALYTAVYNGRDVNTVKLLIENGANIHAVDNYNSSILHTACTFPNSEIIKILLENGANEFNTKDNYGLTPLHELLEYDDRDHHDHHDERIKSFSLLLSYGANPNIQDRNGLTVFDLAKNKNFTEIIGLLGGGFVSNNLDPFISDYLNAFNFGLPHSI